MICLHRIKGDELWVNPDLLVFVEGGSHDTVVTLADGNLVLVAESPAEVAAAVVRFRSTVLAAADELGGPTVTSDVAPVTEGDDGAFGAARRVPQRLEPEPDGSGGVVPLFLRHRR